MKNYETGQTLTSNDHLLHSMQVEIEHSLKSSMPLPIEYISNGAPIKVEPITSIHREVSIIAVGDNHFAIVPTSLTDQSLAYSSKVEKSEKQITYLARRASKPACPNDGSPQDKLLTLELSKQDLDCESCGSPIPLTTETESIEQKQLELGDLTYPKAVFTGNADTYFGELTDKLSSENGEGIATFLSSFLKTNVTKEQVVSFIPLLRPILDKLDFASFFAQGIEAIPAEFSGYLSVAKTLLGDKFDKVITQAQTAGKIFFGYGDQEVNIYKIPSKSTEKLFLTSKQDVPQMDQKLRVEQRSEYAKIFTHLLTGETITVNTAFDMYGIYGNQSEKYSSQHDFFYDPASDRAAFIYQVPDTKYSLMYEPDLKKSTVDQPEIKLRLVDTPPYINPQIQDQNGNEKINTDWVITDPKLLTFTPQTIDSDIISTFDQRLQNAISTKIAIIRNLKSRYPKDSTIGTLYFEGILNDIEGRKRLFLANTNYEQRVRPVPITAKSESVNRIDGAQITPEHTWKGKPISIIRLFPEQIANPDNLEYTEDPRTGVRSVHIHVGDTYYIMGNHPQGTTIMSTPSKLITEINTPVELPIAQTGGIFDVKGFFKELLDAESGLFKSLTFNRLEVWNAIKYVTTNIDDSDSSNFTVYGPLDLASLQNTFVVSDAAKLAMLSGKPVQAETWLTELRNNHAVKATKYSNLGSTTGEEVTGEGVQFKFDKNGGINTYRAGTFGELNATLNQFRNDDKRGDLF